MALLSGVDSQVNFVHVPEIDLLSQALPALQLQRIGDDDPSDSWLQHWMGSLQFFIPETNASKLGINIQLRGGVCNALNLERIITKKVGQKVMIDAQGLAISCKLDWAAQGFLVKSSGGVLATVSDSILTGSLQLTSDKGAPPMPMAISSPRTDCHGQIRVTDLQFTGTLFSQLLQALRLLIEGILTNQLGSIICQQVDEAISVKGSAVLKHLGEEARLFLAQQSHSPSPPDHLSDPHGDLVDFRANPGAQFLDNLFTKVLGNASSPHSLDAVVAHYLGPEGNLSFDPFGIFPVTYGRHIKNLGLVNVTVSSLHLGDLNTWSGLKFKADDQHRLSMGFSMSRLFADVAITLIAEPDDVQPSPLHGKTLKESFDMSLGLNSFGLSGSMFAGLNSTHMRSLTADQLTKAGCLAPGFVSPLETSAAFELALVQTSLAPGQNGSLERDVDVLINQVVGEVLSDYAPAWEAIGNQALSVTIRDMLNDRLSEFMQTPPACPDPVPNFAYPTISQISFYLAVALGSTSLVILLISIVLASPMQRVIAMMKERNARVAPSTSPEVTVEPTAEEEASGLPARESTTEFPVGCRMSSFSEDWEGIALARHPRVRLSVRVCLPALVLTTMLLFVSANSGVGAQVLVKVQVDGEDVLDAPPFFAFSLISSVRDMWRGGVYPLAILIALFSGFWPYLKLVLMLVCWFLPASKLSVERRQSLLDFLDAYGKWSLVDTFVLVIFMVAFHFELSGLGATSPLVADMFKELGSDAKFSVVIDPTPGFHSFLIATVLSLVLGHAMTACHRYALRLGEYGKPAKYQGREVLRGGRRRLCNVLRPGDRVAGKLFAYGPVAAVGCALALVVVGTFLDTMQFRFLGLASFVLGPEASVRPYSIITLDAALPASSLAPNTLGIRWIQIAFFFFSAVVMPAYLAILLCLWVAPLSNRKQRHFFVAAQVLNAWSGVDVFCLSIAASVLEIRQFALFMVGDKCDLINDIVAKSPIANHIEGPVKTCFDVESDLRPGLYILSVAAVIALVTGQILLNRCSSALCATQTHSMISIASTPAHISDRLPAFGVSLNFVD